MCQQDLSTLFQTNIDNLYSNKDDPKIVKKYKNFELNLREGIASLRKPNVSLTGYKLSDLFNAQLLEGTPLEVEKKLLAERWQFIDQLEAEHYFDLEFLVLYFLKLKVLEKLFSFDKQKGTVTFDKLC